jgi:hypothetical protein
MRRTRLWSIDALDRRILLIAVPALGVRAPKNHTRVQGDRWLASADTVT